MLNHSIRLLKHQKADVKSRLFNMIMMFYFDKILRTLVRTFWTSSSGCISMGSSYPVLAISPPCPMSFPGIILKRYMEYHDCSLSMNSVYVVFPGGDCLHHCPGVSHPWPLLQQHRWPRCGLHLEEAGQCGQGELLYNPSLL